MKKKYFLFSFFIFAFSLAQNGAPASPYYNNFNWTVTGNNLKTSLATKITSTHTKTLSYAQAEKALQIVDLDPEDVTKTNVLLIYGFSNNICPTSTADDNDHRRRKKSSDGGGASCEWNREHVYAKSLGTPNLGESGPGADAQHLRAADVQRNGNRGSQKFAAGSGNSGNVSGGWYPGDEWKGDVARNMMYMYLRYGSRCLPTGVGTGSTVPTDTNMLNLFLKWNAEDPVSEYEDNRNTYLGDASNTYGQGNRNPFIDNPYLATAIWGGPIAQNRWPNIILSTENFNLLATISIYPNPTYTHKINIESENELDEIQLININGQVMQSIKKPIFNNNSYTIENLTNGFYFLKLSSENQSVVKKIIVN